MSLKKAAECVRKNNSFIITSHTNVEPDALGSELAFYSLLKKLKKRAVVVNAEKVPLEYSYMRGVEKIKVLSPALKKAKFDCFAIVDCSGLSRCGKAGVMSSRAGSILNIDHHISNDYFADVNWVEPRASSASEMVYSLFKYMRVPLDKPTARLLYLGILTDTGSFRYSNTTGDTHRIAAELLKYGLDASAIYREAYSNIPFRQMRALGEALTGIKIDRCGKLAWLSLKNNFNGRKEESFDLSEQLLSLMRAIRGVEVAVLFRKDFSGKGFVRVNLRSQGKLDVNKIAGEFSGGGHRTASGCTIAGALEKAEKKVLSKIKENIKCR